MKLPLALNIAAAAALIGLLPGCGQTGPLYLPKPPTRPAPAPVGPVPITPAPLSTTPSSQ